MYFKKEQSFSLLAAPSVELVKRVKELYHKRVSDVRFLIPVLTGLEKKEIIAVLPKLVKQSPNVVKEVFNRLLGCFHSKYFLLMLCWMHLFFRKHQIIIYKFTFWEIEQKYWVCITSFNRSSPVASESRIQLLVIYSLQNSGFKSI